MKFKMLIDLTQQTGKMELEVIECPLPTVVVSKFTNNNRADS